MDLDQLKIDRSRRARSRRPRWVKPVVWVVVLGALFWLLRAPLSRAYDALALPEVETARAVKTNPLAATAISGTAANGYIVAARRAALSADTPGRVVEMNVKKGDWIVGRALAELELPKEGVLVLGVTRADGSYVGAPRGDSVFEPGVKQAQEIIVEEEQEEEESGEPPMSNGPAAEDAARGLGSPDTA